MLLQLITEWVAGSKEEYFLSPWMGCQSMIGYQLDLQTFHVFSKPPVEITMTVNQYKVHFNA